MVYDRATKWKEMYPLVTKNSDDAYVSLQHFAGPDAKIQSIFTDNSRELRKSIRWLKWHHKRSTPGISQTNAVAERQIRDILGGSRTLLSNAGRPACFWPYACKT